MTDSPWEGGSRGGTATVKFATDYDAPWYVAAGTPSEIKAQLIEFFGLDEEESKDLPPSSVFLNAVGFAQAEYLAAKRLGGQVIAEQPARRGGGRGRRGGGGNWPGKEAKEEHPFQGVLNQIADASSKEDLQKIWARNQDAFLNEDVAKASEEKAKSL